MMQPMKLPIHIVLNCIFQILHLTNSQIAASFNPIGLIKSNFLPVSAPPLPYCLAIVMIIFFFSDIPNPSLYLQENAYCFLSSAYHNEGIFSIHFYKKHSKNQSNKSFYSYFQIVPVFQLFSPTSPPSHTKAPSEIPPSAVPVPSAQRCRDF